MNVLVTGGAGFIGSNLIHFLLSQKPEWNLINVDSLTYAGNLENLSSCDDNPRYSFELADITDTVRIHEVFDKHHPDFILHLAAESHVDRSVLDPLVFVRTNVLGTQVLLDEMRKTVPGSRFLHVSTDEVYGSLGAEGYFTEETPIAPNSPYSSSKAGSDMLVRAAFITHGLDTVITRCSNNYGPYQFPEKLIPLMLNNAWAGKPLPVYGDGRNVRDWIYVDDHCSALLAVLENGRSGEVYNIGGNNEWANIDIVKLILRQAEASEDLIQFVTDRPGHDHRYAIDATKIEKGLGWQPRHSFEEALPLTIKWYGDNIEWTRRIVSGAYRDYYEQQYGQRLG
ncbi:MAG: dTDP-glucose 4,6-dehydratase [Candidatus Electryonea clarkiae]|nr:dTDP-glucose 4,6-dehydratase [Candidatus Electryonea clarkiae]MDP8287720.1 dTDP-glucose 4,6-dehydratase [Candidatus Electryonea clarkiae]